MDAWFAQLPSPHHRADWTALVAPITPAEVTAAAKLLGRHKTCGLDRMPNAWYKDHITLVDPILAAVFGYCLATSDLPKSFSQAIIFCIPKTSKPTSELCFRLIGLFNTDYKLLTHILVTRLVPFMRLLTHRAQNGFVGGREIHDTINVFSAVQRLVRFGLAPRTTLVLMLDFKKAYNSLDRNCLVRALLWHGLPPDFVALVRRLHKGTAASFQANGHLSDPVDMHNGIRQGCSLAPMLFALALDLLFRRIEADPRCPGIKIQHSDKELAVAMSGCVDDIALFLRGPENEKAYLSILAELKSASGLSLNMTKCTAVCLHPQGPLPRHALMRIPPVPAKQPTRYLGVPVSSAPGVNATWAAVTRAIQARTVLALYKTADVLQRCKLVAAIIVPNILYVARHVWSTADLVEKLDRAIHNFVWTGVFYHKLSYGRKALLNRHHSQLKTEEGGVGEPDVRVELRGMAAATVARWASSHARETQIIGDVLVWK